MNDNTLDAWQLEVGDLILIDGMECEVRDIIEDDENSELVNLRVFNHAANDIEVIPVLWSDNFDIWSL